LSSVIPSEPRRSAVKRVSVVLALALTILRATSFAQTEYVIVNVNAPFENAANLYQLDVATGALTRVAVLETGGTGQGAINFANIQQAITQNAGCVFVEDAGTNDIASFSKASGYAKVGNYTNPAVGFDTDGGSLALTPDSRFLYASYSRTENIGAWTVNPDCSITFIAAYVPKRGADNFADLKVTPNGTGLVVPIPLLQAAELFTIDQSAGTLTDLGFISFDSIHLCDLKQCLPNGLDFTKDSRLVVFASNIDIHPIALSAEITTTGLTNLRLWNLPNQAGIVTNMVPFFSAAGYAGSGNLYFGTSGFGTNRPRGVITTNFTENPLSIVVSNATAISSPVTDGAIAATGSVMVVAEYPNEIGVFSINSDGSLTQLSTTIVENAKPELFSLSVFPNTR